MATIQDVLDDVDGLRGDVAERVAAQFFSVEELAAASAAQLTALKGIGGVMAGRIHIAAAAAQIDDAQTDPTPPVTAAATEDRSATKAHATDKVRELPSAPGGAAPSGAPGLVEMFLETLTVTTRGLADKAPPRLKRVLEAVPGTARQFVEDAPAMARRVMDSAPPRARRLVDAAAQPVQRLLDRNRR